MIVTAQVVQPKNETLTDLSILGVPDQAQSSKPKLTSYPRKFNPDALKVWKSIIEDPSLAELFKSSDLDLMWHTTIREFIGRCDDLGIMPFAGATDTSKNEMVADYVRRARIWLVKFADDCGIFDRVRVRKAYRQYVRRPTGLTIVSWAECYPLREEGFQAWLQTVPTPRFQKQVDNRYLKVIQPHLHMWVEYKSLARVTVGFEIQVPGQITVPGKPTPKRKEVDRFIDNQIFLPIIRACRFKAVRNRLF